MTPAAGHKAPADDELHALCCCTVIGRLMKMLTHRGVLIEEMGQTYLAEPDDDGEETRTLRPLQTAAITYRISFGPRAGHKVLTLRNAAPREGTARQAPCADSDGNRAARRGAGGSTRPQVAAATVPLHHPAGAV